MTINANQLRELIIRPSLREINLWSEDAEELLIATAAHESHLGTYLKQTNGRALGIYQMEPNTHDDIWNRAIKLPYRLILFALNKRPVPERLVYDLRYATQLARLFYMRIPEKLPRHDDIIAIAAYWKRYWNTIEGKGDINDFMDNYKRYIA